MTTSTQPLIQAPRFGRMIDDEGRPTQEFWRHIELVAYRLAKIDEAAREYSALTPGTATTAQIATAINTLVAAMIET